MNETKIDSLRFAIGMEDLSVYHYEEKPLEIIKFLMEIADGKNELLEKQINELKELSDEQLEKIGMLEEEISALMSQIGEFSENWLPFYYFANSLYSPIFRVLFI